ncbi:5389_t:CDS:2 [Ambispora leptoticha]|uniref:5389_t:CDS:1 n=1 Tax=Ambispora leptoticha TaxID=144679 RepID=A0A9N8WDT0_9GLOM|nr:5389_t:CDS:2 [Ambispora leptoticha]
MTAPDQILQCLVEEETQSQRTINKVPIVGFFASIGNNVNQMVGSGIFSTPGIIWRWTGSPTATLLLFFAGAVISMCGSLIYAEERIMIPEMGGEKAYLAKAFPEPHRLFSYLFSVVMITIIRPGTIVAVSNIVAQYALFAFLGFDRTNDADYHPAYLDNGNFWRLRGISLVALLIASGYHCYSNVVANRINQTFSIIKMLILTVIALMGLIVLMNDASNLRVALNLRDAFNTQREDHQHPVSSSDYGAALLMTLFCYEGWNNINYQLDELRDVKKNLVRTGIVSVGAVGALFLLVLISYISVVPDSYILNQNNTLSGANDTLSGANNTSPDDPNEVIVTLFVTFFKNFTTSQNVAIPQLIQESDSIARAFSVFVVISSFGAMAALMWSGARIIVASAQSEYIPRFSNFLKRRHEDRATYTNAFVAQMIWCALITILAPTTDPFSFLVSLSQYTTSIVYGAAAIGLLHLRYTAPNLPRPTPVPKLIVYIFLLVIALILILPFTKDLQQLPFVISLCVIGLGVTAWYWKYYALNPSLVPQSDSDTISGMSLVCSSV